MCFKPQDCNFTGYLSLIISKWLAADKAKKKSFIMDSERYWGEKKSHFYWEFYSQHLSYFAKPEAKKHPVAANATYSC